MKAIQGKTKTKITVVIMSVAIAVLSFFATWQIRSVSVNRENQKTPELARAEELQKQLKVQLENEDKLQKELEEQRKTIEQLRNQNADEQYKAMKTQLDKAEMLAGLTAVTGKGVTVVLDDTEKKVVTEGDPNNYIIHDSDVLQVLNELRDAGAEALSINGERILATTEVRCAGSVISANNRRIGAPFTIKAIGDPQKLSAALNLRNGVADNMRQWGIKVTISQQDQLTVEAYKGGVQFEYAKRAE